jgi:hypothetical protein
MDTELFDAGLIPMRSDTEWAHITPRPPCFYTVCITLVMGDLYVQEWKYVVCADLKRLDTATRGTWPQQFTSQWL